VFQHYLENLISGALYLIHQPQLQTTSVSHDGFKKNNSESIEELNMMRADGGCSHVTVATVAIVGTMASLSKTHGPIQL